MKILHCTDLHFSTSAINWIEEHWRNYDVVCLTGDFLDQRVDSELSVEEQVNTYLAWFGSIDRPLFVCSGNHDYFEGSLMWLRSNIGFYGDGSITEINGIRFGCIGYETTDFNRYQLCDVVLYHVPPKGTSCANGSRKDFGCPEIRRALRLGDFSPQYVLCGHVHLPLKNAIRLKSTIVVNAGGNHTNNRASFAEIEIKEQK